MMEKQKYIAKVSQISGFGDIGLDERRRMLAVEERYSFFSNDYYLSLIDWNDPNDPIRRIAIPDPEELRPWGELDASGEHDYVAAPGCEHKYKDTALLLVSNNCGTFCRFCFRKRLFMPDNDEISRDVEKGIKYIAGNPEISNVLITGGDPLMLSTRKLKGILDAIDEIDHVKIIRVGSKMLAFNPHRFLDDPELVETLGRFSKPERRLYFMAHFNHPRELTREARTAIAMLQKAGVVLMNQTPMIKGVNDDPRVLSELLNTLAQLGVSPYYIFQCRPTEGNFTYTVPLEHGYQLFTLAQQGLSGLARRARYVMSHNTGKIEVVGMSESNIFFRYQRAANVEDEGRFLAARRNPDGYWFDDYDAVNEVEVDGDREMAVVC